MDSTLSGFTPIGATTLLAPLPVVLVSCQGTSPDLRIPNLITVAWTGIVCSNPPMLSISLKPQRHSYRQILESQCFCVNLVDRSLCRATDYCGVKSGRDINKFETLDLHPLYLPDFDAPALAEAPAFLCCRVSEIKELGSHTLFLANIKESYVRTTLMSDRQVNLENAHLISYAHGQYYPVSPSSLGFFGYSVARKKTLKRRTAKKR